MEDLQLEGFSGFDLPHLGHCTKKSRSSVRNIRLLHRRLHSGRQKDRIVQSYLKVFTMKSMLIASFDCRNSILLNDLIKKLITIFRMFVSKLYVNVISRASGAI